MALGFSLENIPQAVFNPVASLPSAPVMNWNITDISGAFVQGLKGGMALGEAIGKPIAEAIEYNSPEAKKERDFKEKKRELEEKILNYKIQDVESMLGEPKAQPLASSSIYIDRFADPEAGKALAGIKDVFVKAANQEADPEKAKKWNEKALMIENQISQLPKNSQKINVSQTKEIQPTQHIVSPFEKVLATIDAQAPKRKFTFDSKGDREFTPEYKKWLDRREKIVSENDKQQLAPEGLNDNQIKAMNQIRDDYNQDAYIKTAKEAFGSKNVVRESLSKKNGLGDIAAINAFQRMVDPGATVREGDVALIQTASAFLSRMNPDYWIKKLKSGDKLPDDVRNQMNELSNSIYRMRAKNANEISIPQFRKVSKAARVPDDLIATNFVIDDESQQSEAGAVSILPVSGSTTIRGGTVKRLK